MADLATSEYEFLNKVIDDEKLRVLRELRDMFEAEKQIKLNKIYERKRQGEKGLGSIGYSKAARTEDASAGAASSSSARGPSIQDASNAPSVGTRRSNPSPAGVHPNTSPSPSVAWQT